MQGGLSAKGPASGRSKIKQTG